MILPFVIHQLNAKTRGLGHLKAKASADWSGEVINVNKEGERHVVKHSHMSVHAYNGSTRESLVTMH
jgi:hypothetical protein